MGRFLGEGSQSYLSSILEAKHGLPSHHRGTDYHALLFSPLPLCQTLDGKTHTINVESYKSVLEAALDEGIELPHDCKLGACLACSAKVVSGTVDQTGSTLDDSLIEAGFALTCCAYPQSDVVIRSIPEDELIDEQFAPL